jgi:hypothetical protein
MIYASANASKSSICLATRPLLPRQVFLPSTNKAAQRRRSVSDLLPAYSTMIRFFEIVLSPGIFVAEWRNCPHQITLLCAGRSEILLWRCAWHC